MVRAILDGRKTQTRRLAKHFNDPELFCQYVHENAPGEFIGWVSEKAPDLDFSKRMYPKGSGIFCPYGMPGDQLWVREAFGRLQDEDGGGYVYRADLDPDGDSWIKQPWKPSIHMPREASRITLEIKSIRVERIQGISKEDAIDEGVFFNDILDGWQTDNEGRNFHGSDPRISFEGLWSSINGPKSWGENPWVWVIEFEKLK